MSARPILDKEARVCFNGDMTTDTAHTPGRVPFQATAWFGPPEDPRTDRRPTWFQLQAMMDLATGWGLGGEGQPLLGRIASLDPVPDTLWVWVPADEAAHINEDDPFITLSIATPALGCLEMITLELVFS